MYRTSDILNSSYIGKGTQDMIIIIEMYYV